MKYVLILMLLVQSCTVVKITNSFNVYTDCNRYMENHCVSYDYVDIIVKGSPCDYQQFLDSKLDKNVLLNKGYSMVIDHDTVIFTTPNL